MKQSHGSALLAKKVVAEKLENVIRDSIVASIPACHAGDRGLIPRRGGEHFCFRVAAAGDKTGDVEEEEGEEEGEVEDKIDLAVHADAGMAVHKDGTEHDDRDAGGNGRRAEWKGEDMGGGGSNGSDDGGQGPTNRSRAGEGPASGATWLGVHLSLICSGMGSITSKAAQVKLHYHEEFLRTF